MGTMTTELGPKSHHMIVNEILPQLDDVDSGYTPYNIERIPETSRWLYLNLMEHFPFGSLRIAPKDGTRYWHPEFDDHQCLFQFPKHEGPSYPKHNDDKFYVGTQLNKILRHYIGRPGRNETRKKYVKCNEGGWVLLEDLLSLDFIWKDNRYYRHEEEHNWRNFLVTRKERIGLIVELTVAE